MLDNFSRPIIVLYIFGKNNRYCGMPLLSCLNYLKFNMKVHQVGPKLFPKQYTYNTIEIICRSFAETIYLWEFRLKNGMISLGFRLARRVGEMLVFFCSSLSTAISNSVGSEVKIVQHLLF